LHRLGRGGSDIPCSLSGPDLFTDNKRLDKQAMSWHSVKEKAFIRSNFKETQKDSVVVKKSLVKSGKCVSQI
jgi:hypothetical protein